VLDVKEAYTIAKAGIKDKLTDCYDTGNAFAFYFDSGDGSPYIVVNKKTKEKTFLTVPPVSNIRKLEQGKKINADEITKLPNK
jgi:hypothetical protein